MKLGEAIKIKEHNRHIGILCPTDAEFEADDLSIEALRRVSYTRYDPSKNAKDLLPGETDDE